MTRQLKKEMLAVSSLKRRYSPLLQAEVTIAPVSENQSIEITPEREKLLSLSAGQWRKVHKAIKRELINGNVNHNWTLVCTQIFGKPLDPYEYRDLLINHPYITPLCHNWQDTFLTILRRNTLVVHAQLSQK